MKKFLKYILISSIVSIFNIVVYGDFDRTESTGELLFMIFFMIIMYNIFILIIPTIIYLATKSMNAFKISFFIICGFFAILVLAFFTDPENLIEILKKYNLPINYSKYVNKKTIPSLIKKIAFDKKVINEDVNIVLIGKNGGFIKKILIRDLKSILNQIK